MFVDADSLRAPDTRGSDTRPTRVVLSVAIPCFNESAVIIECHRRVSAACRAAVGDRYELNLVDDGSSDDTWHLIRSLAETDPHVVALRLSRNHGHQIALSAALRETRGDLVLILDADLQDPPELLADMMRMIEAGADVVYGQRIARDGENWFKKITACIFYRLMGALSDTPIAPDTGDFRLMRRQVVDVLNDMPERHRFLRGMIGWIGFDQRPVRYHRQARLAGTSHYGLARMLQLAADAVTSFSVRPLKLAAGLGLTAVVVGMSLLAYVLYGWANGLTLPGWSSLMIVTLFLGGTQLVVLGVFGEYLGRLFIESKQRPLYIVRERIGQVLEKR